MITPGCTTAAIRLVDLEDAVHPRQKERECPPARARNPRIAHPCAAGRHWDPPLRANLKSALTCSVLSAGTTTSGRAEANHLSVLCTASTGSSTETQEEPGER